MTLYPEIFQQASPKTKDIVPYDHSTVGVYKKIGKNLLTYLIHIQIYSIFPTLSFMYLRLPTFKDQVGKQKLWKGIENNGLHRK